MTSLIFTLPSVRRVPICKSSILSSLRLLTTSVKGTRNHSSKTIPEYVSGRSKTLSSVPRLHQINIVRFNSFKSNNNNQQDGKKLLTRVTFPEFEAGWRRIRGDKTLTIHQKQEKMISHFDSYKVPPLFSTDMLHLLRGNILTGVLNNDRLIDDWNFYKNLKKNSIATKEPWNKELFPNSIFSFTENNKADEDFFNVSNKLTDEQVLLVMKDLKDIWMNTSLTESQSNEKIASIFKKYNIFNDDNADSTNLIILQKEIMADKEADEQQRLENLLKLNKNILHHSTQKNASTTNESHQKQTENIQNTQKSQPNDQSPFNFSSKNTKGRIGRPNDPKELIIEIKPLTLFAIFFVPFIILYLWGVESRYDKEITFQEFENEYLKHNRVKMLLVGNSTVRVMLNDDGRSETDVLACYFTISSVKKFEQKLKKAQEELGIPEENRVPVTYSHGSSIVPAILSFLPTVLFLGFLYWSSKTLMKGSGSMGGGLFGQNKKKFKKFNAETNVKVNFADVAGCDEAKEEIMEFVKFLKNPQKYERLGAKIPRGAILSGPPGTGKTLLAKATAGEAGVPFYSVSGSEFVEMFVGVGASRVRELFKTARENAPAIVFVDEIDAIGKSRGKSKAAGGNDERENTLNQLLVEMDGFQTSDHVVVLAGTNRADVLDSALLRPGRFDRKVYIDNPELEGRKDIFAVHLKKIKLAPDCDMEDLKGRLSALTPGFSGADIANVCNEAALIAARHDEQSVKLHDFEQAIERVIAGLEKKTKLLSPEEKKVVAYHEAGHAICGWFLEFADPLLKVSIVPRGQGALGYAQYLPPDIYLYTTQKLLDRMTMTLGGRVSEELHFSSVTSGASDDFEKVTNMAQRMVLECGMSPRVGTISYTIDRGQDFTKPYSDHTAVVIDEEIRRIVEECYIRCKSLLVEKSHEVELVAQELLTKEVITREDMIRLLGKRPFPNRNDAFDKYLAGDSETDKKRDQ